MSVTSIVRYVIGGALAAWLGIAPVDASSDRQKGSGTQEFAYIRFYNGVDGKGDNSCTIAIHDLPTHGVVRLKDNVTGCGPAYDKAYSMSIQNLPAGTKIKLYTHVDCGISKPWAEVTLLQADTTRPYFLLIDSLFTFWVPIPNFNPLYFSTGSNPTVASASVQFNIASFDDIPLVMIGGKLKCIEYDIH